ICRSVSRFARQTTGALTPMKRILVIDESEVIRETLALILGREFVVMKRPHSRGAFSFSDSDTEVDLLIMGLTPTIGVESSALLRFAARAPFAVLFLVDSKSVAKAIEDRDKVGYLAQKSFELSCNGRLQETVVTLLIENLEKVLPSGQSALLNFLEEDRLGEWRLLTTARADLLAKVYQGEFLESLYYKLATLTLRLAPLRDRREDIPTITTWLARLYARTVGLGEVTFSPGASERLSNYLWFGNLHELETVVARTLVLRRKHGIEPW